VGALTYVGRNPDSDGIVVPKGYADTQRSTTALTTAAVNAQVASAVALLTNQSYVDIQDAGLAKKADVTAADTAYVSNTVLNAANGVAGLDSSGSLFTAQLPTGMLTDRVMKSYSMAPLVTFEAVGTPGYAWSTTGTTKAVTGTHNAAGGANNVVLCYVNSAPSGSSLGTPGASVSYGGTAMHQWGSPVITVVSGVTRYQSVFYLFNPPSGAKSVVTTMTTASSATWSITAQTVSYLNVASVGTLATNVSSAGSTTATLSSVPCPSQGLVSAMVAVSVGSGTGKITTFNQTSRFDNNATASTGLWTIVGEGAGAATISFASTLGLSEGWAVLGVPLVASTSVDTAIGTLNFSGSWTATGSSTQNLASYVIPDPGYPWRPWPMAWVMGASSGATQPAARTLGTGSYGLLTVVSAGASPSVYGLGICTGSFYPNLYPVLPAGIVGQTPATIPPVIGGLELDLVGQLWSGSTYSFYSTALVFTMLVVPAI
jgi:hypothetical protein